MLTAVPRIEGVNDVAPNTMTLHVGTTCTMPSSRTETGTPTGLDCNVNTDGNSGCGVQATQANSYGPGLNSIGGGWYAMERTDDFIKVWFFPRNGNTPSDVSSGAGSINTSNWVTSIIIPAMWRRSLTMWQGTPTAFFPNTQCNIASDFDANNIIINLTFCTC